VNPRGVRLTAEALAQRRPVWAAMSDVFLDTETRWYFPRIAQTLVESGLAWDALEGIWRDEIYPECWGNLLSVAGEWAMMSLNEARLIRRAEAGPTRVGRLFYRWSAGAIHGQWQALGTFFQLRAALPPGARAPQVEVWSLLAYPYLERDLAGALFLEEKRGALGRTGWTLERVRETFERDFRPIYRALLTGKERREEAARAANVAAFLAPLAEAQGTATD
jgi:hypothetical protein